MSPTPPTPSTPAALIVVDVQNDFCPGGALAVPDGDAVVAVANALMHKYDTVVLTQDWHPVDHGSFAANHPGRSPGEVIDLAGLDQILWPVHCVQGTEGAAFHPDLHTATAAAVFRKGTDAKIDSYSGFHANGHRRATGLADWLRERAIGAVTICGLATDYCVRFTALDAVREGFEVTLVLDGCRGVELSPGDTAGAVAALRAAGVRVVRSAELLAAGPVDVLAEGRYLRLVARGRWEFVERVGISGIVIIVAVTDNDELVLVEQHRPPIAASCIELPAGLAGDVPGEEDEPLERAARRELVEETGYEADSMWVAFRAPPSAGMSSEVYTVFVARGLRRVGAGGGDGSECIQVHHVPLAEVDAWLATRQREGTSVALSVYAGLAFTRSQPKRPL